MRLCTISIFIFDWMARGCCLLLLLFFRLWEGRYKEDGGGVCGSADVDGVIITMLMVGADVAASDNFICWWRCCALPQEALLHSTAAFGGVGR